MKTRYLKAIYLPGTVLSLGLLVSNPVSAVDITENIGLDFVVETIYGSWNDDASAANAAESDIFTDGEVHFSGAFETDSGLTIGAEVELSTAQGSTGNADELYAYISGSFGRIEAGDQDGAANSLGWEVPNVGYGQVGGDYADFVGPTSVVEVANSGDDTKVTYYTPSLKGMTLGISYAPFDEEGNAITTAQGEEEDQVELGLSYSRAWNGVEIEIGAGYFSDNQESGSEDFGAWSSGINVSMSDITFGLGYVDDGDGGAAAGSNSKGIAGGISYAMDEWSVAASYAQNEANAPTGQDSDVFGAGVNYEWMPLVKGNTPVAINIGADIIAFSRDASTDASVASSDGELLVISTSVEF